jgi:tetratricopeptide (TPR) repeat protein
LKNNTRILSEAELLKQYRDGRFTDPELSQPCVIITFDDGYLDNYTLAYPILKYHEVPAILFVATQMVNARQIPWWDTIAYLIKQCAKPCIDHAGQQVMLGNQKSEAIAFFQLQMKQAPYEHTKYLLAELSEACEVALPPPEVQDKEILTWDQIREMARNGIAIGSHTHSHRVLATLGSSAQKEEMILSKLIIEENIGQPVLSISYPVGELHYITADTSIIAESTGYLLGFTTNTGVNDWQSIEPYGVKRTARLLEKVSTVSLLTVLPGLFSWDSAASFAIKMMETHPTYADAYYRLGIIHLGQAKIEQAIGNFQKAVDSNPDYTEARIKLGISLGFAGRYDEAEKNLLFILHKRPSFADIHYYLGIIHASNKQTVQAVSSLEKAVEINPTYKDAMLKLGVLYCQQQKYNLAFAMLERASRIDPPDQDLLALVEAGKKIVAAHGTDSLDFVPLFASCVGNIEQIDELVRGFVTHLSISPNLNDIMTIIEKGAFARDNLESLVLLFQEYRATFPGYSDIHYILGILYKKLDDNEGAEECLKESIRLNSNYVKARLALFNLLKERGRFPEALEHGYALEQYNLLYPDLYCGLAETFVALGRYLEAEKFAQKAIAISPVYQRVHQVFLEINAHHDRG